MRRWFKEPLLHFLVLGASLFGVYAWLHHGNSGSWDNGAGPVRITATEVSYLTQTWERLQQREPTREELHALVAGYLKEELLGREARAMGLEQNDPIIRRRLAQKVEFIVKDTSRLTEPTADDLHRFYQANMERFQSPARMSFTHVFFDPKDARTLRRMPRPHSQLYRAARRPSATLAIRSRLKPKCATTLCKASPRGLETGSRKRFLS